MIANRAVHLDNLATGIVRAFPALDLFERRLSLVVSVDKAA
jgi:hypothetical protein